MKLDKKNIFDIYPLTEVQHGILFESFKGSLGKTYFIQLSIGYDFLLDENRFVAAWKRIYADNELLRAVVRWKKISRPVLVILNDTLDRIRVVAAPNIPFENFKSYADVHCVEQLDVEKEVFTVTLHQINNSKSLVEIRSHHLIQDGWSTSILINEFIRQYLAESDVHVPKTRFKEYISFVQAQYNNEQAQRYWSTYLTGLQSAQLVENTSSAVSKHESYITSFDSSVCQSLKYIASEHNVSLPTILHLAWSMALGDHLRTDDVIFGSVVSGRPAQLRGIDRMVGNFINTLPCRVRFSPEMSVRQALQELQKSMSARTAVEWHSIGQIKQMAGIDATTNLFDTVLVIENYPFDQAVIYEGKLKASYAEMQESGNYPLDISINISAQIDVNVKYDANRITAENAIFLINSFEKALMFICAHLEAAANAFSSIAVEEKERILTEFNKPVNAGSFPAKSITTLYDEQVAKTPGSIALVCNGVTLTYKALQQAVNALACKLKINDVKNGEVIGVYTAHSFDRIISLLAILKAGAVFLPFKVKEPLENVLMALGICSSSKLLVEQTFAPLFVGNKLFTDTMLITTDTDGGEAAEKEISFDRSAATYIMMTSGSTGVPKAVLVEQQSLLNTIHWFVNEYQIKSGTRILQLTDYTFDPSFEDIFGGLIAGAEIHLPSVEVLMDARACYRYLHDSRINIVNYVPSVLYEVLGKREKIDSLQVVISGGEALSETIKNELLQSGYVLYNNYGPTEATIDCLSSKCGKAEVNLGRPIANAYCLLLDERNHLTPINRPGEICIGGLGVSRGYVNNPSLTAEKFISDPFNPGRILYKTGDFGKWQADGTIVYLGRKDSQIKINGIRIELGAIKVTINRIAQVLQSEVLVVEPGKRLVAFVQLKKDEIVFEDDVLAFLRDSLPIHMIPKTVLLLDKFPLTANGKIDVSELIRINYQHQHKAEYKAPLPSIPSPDAAAMITIWGAVLGIDHVDPDKSFFELGGDSFGLMKCVNRVNEHFKIDLPISAFFSYPSISLLSQHIQDFEEGNVTREDSSSMRIQDAKDRLQLIRRNR